MSHSLYHGHFLANHSILLAYMSHSLFHGHFLPDRFLDRLAMFLGSQTQNQVLNLLGLYGAFGGTFGGALCGAFRGWGEANVANSSVRAIHVTSVSLIFGETSDFAAILIFFAVILII
jgi:hypothetical protein